MKRRVTLVLVLLSAALGVGGWFYLNPNPESSALKTRELATRGLAEYLARTFPAKRALIISNPFTREKQAGGNMKAYEEAGLRGLRRGFAYRIAIEAVAFPELKPGARENPQSFVPDVQTPTPLSYVVAPGSFDQLARQHSSCSLLVSLIGLPADLSKVELWQARDGPKLALLLPDLRMIGDAAAVRSAVKDGKIAAFVLNKPGAPPEQELPGRDFAAEFEKRFLLVTPENIDQVLQTWPQLF